MAQSTVPGTTMADLTNMRDALIRESQAQISAAHRERDQYKEDAGLWRYYKNLCTERGANGITDLIIQRNEAQQEKTLAIKDNIDLRAALEVAKQENQRLGVELSDANSQLKDAKQVSQDLAKEVIAEHEQRAEFLKKSEVRVADLEKLLHDFPWGITERLWNEWMARRDRLLSSGSAKAAALDPVIEPVEHPGISRAAALRQAEGVIGELLSYMGSHLGQHSWINPYQELAGWLVSRHWRENKDGTLQDAIRKALAYVPVKKP